jgi:predicted FMN-binding regulatory protein PaiB
MFVRPCWRPLSEQDALELIEKNPWALLVSNGATGPLATNLPLLFDHRREDKTVLVGHLARASELVSKPRHAVYLLLHSGALLRTDQDTG